MKIPELSFNVPIKDWLTTPSRPGLYQSFVRDGVAPLGWGWSEGVSTPKKDVEKFFFVSFHAVPLTR